MNLIVLFGGVSSEHDISCISAASILRNIDHGKYDVFAVGITADGRWFLCEDAQPDAIQDGSWERGALTPAVLSPDRSTHGLLVLRSTGVEVLRADVVFPVLHGVGGEDGTVQGLLELAGVPYVGCGVAASANTMDKSITKVILEQAGVRQAAYYLARRAQFARDPESVVTQAMRALGSWPVFVKPCSSGSSVGVTRADGPEALRAGLEEAFRWDGKVLVEEFIDGHEVEVAVLGNESPVASTAGEIAPTQEFYTFDAKYNDESSALYIPAHIDERAMETVRETAVRVYQALGCRGLSRVDFFCTYQGSEIVLNEVNTIPGFTSISMYPKLFAESGIPYAKLIDRLVEFALEAAHG
ncbi:D-alanine--D-alanine ligase family protein [Intestinibacillus massiliensis]|uniref:D-alanine--D-alanine ligase family protein n=1 Tax=Intestinibacillus massiliensis TaxID=1871029 RepID=UPI000B34B8C6|nr:D-alanine--D-alanine ligase family protein [Intestinibacillus massiliensis]